MLIENGTTSRDNSCMVVHTSSDSSSGLNIIGYNNRSSLGFTEVLSNVTTNKWYHITINKTGASSFNVTVDDITVSYTNWQHLSSTNLAIGIDSWGGGACQVKNIIVQEA